MRDSDSKWGLLSTCLLLVSTSVQEDLTAFWVVVGGALLWLVIYIACSPRGKKLWLRPEGKWEQARLARFVKQCHKKAAQIEQKRQEYNQLLAQGLKLEARECKVEANRMIRSYNLFIQAHESLWKHAKHLRITTYISLL